jgi:hypothetical protein
VPASQQIETYTGADIVVGLTPHRLVYLHTGGAWRWRLDP